MDYREYASREAKALARQLLDRHAQVSADQLRAVRDALDAAARAAETASKPSPADEQGVEELVRRLTTAAEAGVKAAAQRIQEDAQKAVDAAHAERDAQRTRAEQLATRHAQLEAHVQALEADLRSEKERADTADRDLDSALEAHRDLEAVLTQAEATGREAADARAAVARELQDTRALLEEALAESARLGGQLDHEVAEKAALTSDLFAVREEQEHLEAARARTEADFAHEADVRARIEQELVSVKAALDASVAVAARLRDELQERMSESGSLTADLERLRAELRHAHTDLQALAAERDHLTAVHEQLAAERDATHRQLTATAAERDAIAAERTAIAEQRDLFATERDELAAARASLNADAEATRARLQSLDDEVSRQAGRIAHLERDLADAMQARTRLQDQQTVDERDRETTRSQVDEIRHERERMASLLGGALSALDRLAQATTVTDLLAALVQQMALALPRIALFRVKGNRLEGEHQVGFEQAADVAKLVLPMNVDSLPTRAVTAGTLQSVAAGELADGRLTPLGPTTAAALAIPLIAYGEPLAVLYAEHDADASTSAGGTSASPGITFAMLLARHTTVLLTQLAEELKALAALREYAAMLLQEARQMHDADTQAGRKPDDVRRRLEDTIECARELYAQRAALEGTSAAGLFDEQIVAALELESDSAFARDLAAATHLEEVAAPLSGRQAAEAS